MRELAARCLLRRFQAYAQCILHQGNVDASRKLLEQCVLVLRQCNNPVGESVAIATAAASLEPSIDAKPMLQKALGIAKECHSVNNCVSYLIRLGNLFACVVFISVALCASLSIAQVQPRLRPRL
jgi:hypothetical protein